MVNSAIGKIMRQFWLSGWGIDWLYERLFVRPYYAFASLLKAEPVDAVYGLVVTFNEALNGWLSQSQTGRMRWYITSMVAGLVVLVAVALQLSPEAI